MSSQQSFESRLGRFTNGLSIITSWPDYSPPNVLIAKAALTAFVAQVQGANTQVSLATDTLGDLVSQRQAKAYSKNNPNPNCLERRIRNIIHFIRSYESSTSPSSHNIRALLRKARPYYRTVKETKKKGGVKKIKPSIQSSYDSFFGIARDVHTILTLQGAAYNPNNPALQPPHFLAFVEELQQLSSHIGTAQVARSEAISTRRGLYDGETGMNTRIALIKNYLACFEGGKKSNHFIEFNRAIKG